LKLGFIEGKYRDVYKMTPAAPPPKFSSRSEELNSCK